MCLQSRTIWSEYQIQPGPWGKRDFAVRLQAEALLRCDMLAFARNGDECCRHLTLQAATLGW